MLIRYIKHSQYSTELRAVLLYSIEIVFLTLFDKPVFRFITKKIATVLIRFQ